MHPYHIYTCKHNRSHSLLGTDTLEVAELKKFYGPLVVFFFIQLITVYTTHMYNLHVVDHGISNYPWAIIEFIS